MLCVFSMKITIDVHSWANDQQGDHANCEDKKREEGREDASRIDKVSLAGRVPEFENYVRRENGEIHEISTAGGEREDDLREIRDECANETEEIAKKRCEDEGYNWDGRFVGRSRVGSRGGENTR
jgi:hypothetical protein